MAIVIAQSKNTARVDSCSPEALGEKKYQDLKARGLLPQPDQVPTPRTLGPRQTITPETKERLKGLLIPPDETFSVLGAGEHDRAGVGSESSGHQERDDKCGTAAAEAEFFEKGPRARPTLDKQIVSDHFITHYTLTGPNATTLPSCSFSLIIMESYRALATWL